MGEYYYLSADKSKVVWLMFTYIYRPSDFQALFLSFLDEKISEGQGWNWSQVQILDGQCVCCVFLFFFFSHWLSFIFCGGIVLKKFFLSTYSHFMKNYEHTKHLTQKLTKNMMLPSSGRFWCFKLFSCL